MGAWSENTGLVRIGKDVHLYCGLVKDRSIDPGPMKIPQSKRYFKLLALLILTGYVFVVALAWIFQEKLIFFPRPVAMDFKFENGEEVFLSTTDQVELNALFFPAPSDRVILYFHGNGGSLDSWQLVEQNFRSLGYNFFIIDYRGYGKSTGEISESGLYTDAATAFDFLLRKGFSADKVIIFGRSLGTGVAVNLASKRNVRALILESPFTSVRQVAVEKFPFLFPSLYIRYQVDNLARINEVKAPLLVIHGKKDNTIPYRHGLGLYNAFRGQKKMIAVAEGTHNNLEGFPGFAEGIGKFLAETEPTRPNN